MGLAIRSRKPCLSSRLAIFKGLPGGSKPLSGCFKVANCCIASFPSQNHVSGQALHTSLPRPRQVVVTGYCSWTLPGSATHAMQISWNSVELDNVSHGLAVRAIPLNKHLVVLHFPLCILHILLQFEHFLSALLLPCSFLCVFLGKVISTK